MTIHDDDLAGNPCAVTDCIDRGELRACVTVTPLPDVNAVEDHLEFDVWLCEYHGHLVRSDVETIAFTPPPDA